MSTTNRNRTNPWRRVGTPPSWGKLGGHRPALTNLKMEAGSKTETTGIHRVGPPVATQKLRQDVYAVQVALSEPPSADWKRFFYDLQRDAPPDFPPRSVDITGAMLRFRSGAESVEQKIALVDHWMERANRKEASLGRSEQDRHRREESAREHRELADLNERWSKL